MAQRFQLSRPAVERPATAWAEIAVELLGSQSFLIDGADYQHHVIHKGQGPTLLMYHGVGGHAETYARTLPAIAAAGYSVYAVDALYHGYSSKPEYPLDWWESLDHHVEAIVDLLDALGCERVHFEGESLGAALGCAFALRHPDRCHKVILNGFGPMVTNAPMADFPPSPGPSMAALGPLSVAAVTDPTFENIQQRLHWLVKDPALITDEMVRIRQRLYQDPEINRSMRGVFGIGRPAPDMAAYMQRAPKEDDIRAAWQPETLVMWGTHNPGHGVEYGEYCADVIGAVFYEFADTGHWPQWEKPDEYAQVIIEFLRDSNG